MGTGEKPSASFFLRPQFPFFLFTRTACPRTIPPGMPPHSDTYFTDILDQYGQVLRQAVARYCPKDMGLQISEIEQDVRIRLWRALQSEKEIREPASYLYRIAATATIDAVRRIKARRESSLYLSSEEEETEDTIRPLPVNPDLSPDRIVEQQQTVDKITAALSQLADNRRRAVSLHLEGWSSQQIADLLGWTEAKARNLLYRGLSELREMLRAEGIEYET
jgi:RNA polymerase sigma-70 factor, ECF subfamily